MATVSEIIQAINAWADMQHTQRDQYGNVLSNSRFRMANPDAYAIKCAAGDAQEIMDQWPEIRRIDDTHAVLQAPDGTEVLYDHSGGAERLALITIETIPTNSTLSSNQRGDTMMETAQFTAMLIDTARANLPSAQGDTLETRAREAARAALTEAHSTISQQDFFACMDDAFQNSTMEAIDYIAERLVYEEFRAANPAPRWPASTPRPIDEIGRIFQAGTGA